MIRGGGLLLYVQGYIPCRRITVNFTQGIEAIVVENNLQKRKWLLIGSYCPHKEMINNHLNIISNRLNDLCTKYENIILIGDFNSEMSEEAMNSFCSIYNLKSLVHDYTCFKNIDNPSCIDLILTNKSLCFQNTSVIDNGLSDFHKLTLNTMKASFQKQEPKILHYRNYKIFDNGSFRNDLLYGLSKIGFSNISCEQFEILFLTTLNKHPPTP